MDCTAALFLFSSVSAFVGVLVGFALGLRQ